MKKIKRNKMRIIILNAAWMSSVLIFTFATFIVMGGGLTPLHAQDTGVKIEAAHAYATPPVVRNGAIFLKITGPADDRLIGASLPDGIVDRVELHTHIHQDGIMRMREVEAFSLPANLMPGGDHIMLFGLAAPLINGQSLDLTLSFEKSGQQHVTVPIIAPGTTFK